MPLKAGLGPYRGLGTWVDIYDSDQWDHPARTVREAQALGVRTIYLETGNHARAEAIFRPRAASRMIEAAHAAGLEVVAWYLPGFRDLDQDLRRSLKAVEFTTPTGHGFDGFGLDIEANIVRSIPRRIDRMLRLSRRIRSAVGEAYALGAIIPSPRGMELSPGYWGSDFPYEELDALYDVFLPMGYYTYRTEGEAAAHDYTARSIQIIRRESGNRKAVIHPIGGLGADADRAEVRGFVRAAREYGTLGASFYDYATTRPGGWLELRKMPKNRPPLVAALPIRVGDMRPFGNVSEDAWSHPNEIFYKSGPVEGDVSIGLEGFDIDEGEVKVWVNWRHVATLPSGPAGLWGLEQEVLVPSSYLDGAGPNHISFRGSPTDEWGIRSVVLQP